jgi:hypothetical protein
MARAVSSIRSPEEAGRAGLCAITGSLDVSSQAESAGR